MLTDRVSNEWTLYATEDIQECADLDGRRLGIGSTGDVIATMVVSWVDSECPGTEPDYLPLGQSDTRNAAFFVGEIDANIFELADAIKAEADYPGRFHLLASFAQSLPDLHPTTLYGNTDFIQRYPSVVEDLIRAQLEVHRQIADEPEYMTSLVQEYLPELADDSLDSIIEQYIELDMFPVNGGLTEDGIQFTIDFFADAIDEMEPDTAVDAVADLSFLDVVLDEIGRR